MQSGGHLEAQLLQLHMQLRHLDAQTSWARKVLGSFFIQHIWRRWRGHPLPGWTLTLGSLDGVSSPGLLARNTPVSRHVLPVSLFVLCKVEKWTDVCLLSHLAPPRPPAGASSPPQCGKAPEQPPLQLHRLRVTSPVTQAGDKARNSMPPANHRHKPTGERKRRWQGQADVPQVTSRKLFFLRREVWNEACTSLSRRRYHSSCQWLRAYHISLAISVRCQTCSAKQSSLLPSAKVNMAYGC